MLKKYIRFLLFTAAAVLTVVLPLLIKDEVSAGLWIALGFTVLAEALVFLPAVGLMKVDMPVRLPLFLYVNPLYLLFTILMAVFSYKLSWRHALAIELIAAFIVFAAYAVSVLAVRDKEDK